LGFLSRIYVPQALLLFKVLGVSPYNLLGEIEFLLFCIVFPLATCILSPMVLLEALVIVPVAGALAAFRYWHARRYPRIHYAADGTSSLRSSCWRCTFNSYHVLFAGPAAVPSETASELLSLSGIQSAMYFAPAAYMMAVQVFQLILAQSSAGQSKYGKLDTEQQGLSHSVSY